MLAVANRFNHVIEVVGARGTGHDRAAVIELSGGVAIAVADGAGGTGDGAIAADAVIEAVRDATEHTSWASLLVDVDRDAKRLKGALTTAVIANVTSRGISGASVGDSIAWVIRGTTIEDLSDGQLRKPLLGDGCIPRKFRSRSLGSATLLVATDGLWRYASQSAIVRIASRPDLRDAARALIELVRLPSGALQDDVAVVLCRHESGRD